MATFDAFADEYIFWIERVNPRRYPHLDDFIPTGGTWALDAGCGPGQLSWYLAARATHVVGLDLSRAMITLAQQQGKQQYPGVAFLVADLEQAPFKAGTFDVVGSDAVLHMTRREMAVPTLRDLVKPGGRLMIRELVMRHPRWTTFPVRRLVVGVWHVPRYLRAFGWRTAWRLWAFETSRAWTRQQIHASFLTPEAFQEFYSQVLPGARFVTYGWAMAAFWEAPAGS